MSGGEWLEVETCPMLGFAGADMSSKSGGSFFSVARLKLIVNGWENKGAEVL